MSSVPPPPSPALLRRALGEWRRDRRGAVAAAVVVVLAGAVLAVVAGAEPTREGDPGLRELATAAVTAAALTTVLLALIAHVGVARLRWFGHVVRFPRLLAETFRVPGAAPRALAGLAGGLVLATFVHPVLGLATAGLAIAVLPTDVGRAVAVWRTTGQAAGARVAGRPVTADPDRWRLTALTAALGLTPVALLRLLVLEPACTLDRVLGAACPDGAVATSATAVAVAIGAVAVTPFALGLGDVLARSLDGESFGAPAADLPGHVDVLPPSPPPAASAPDDDVPEVAAEPAIEEPPAEEAAPDDPALEELALRELALQELALEEPGALSEAGPAEEPAFEEPQVTEEPSLEDAPPPAPALDEEPPAEVAPEVEDEPADLAAEVPALWPDARPVASPLPAVTAEDDLRSDDGRDDEPEGEPTVEIPPVRPDPPTSTVRRPETSEPEPEPEPQPEPEPEPGSEPEPEPEPETELRPRPVPAAATAAELPDLFGGPSDRAAARVDAAIARARPSLESLTPATRSAAVLLFSSLTDGAVDPDADAIEELRRSLQAAPLETTRSTLSLVRANAGRLDALRSQYQRSPRIARGAIERAASVGLRAAGLPGEEAESLAETLLTLDAEDWGHLTAALEALDDELDRA